MATGMTNWICRLSGLSFGGLMIEDERTTWLRHHCLHYASGVFEGICVVEIPGGRHIFRYDDHLNRLLYSAEQYGLDPLPVDRQQLYDAGIAVIDMNPGHTYLRPIIFRGSSDQQSGLGVDPTDVPIMAAIMSENWRTYLRFGRCNDGVTAVVTHLRRPAPDGAPTDAKVCGSYGIGQMAKRLARLAGASEAILMAANGDYIAEGTGMNLFIVTDRGQIVTPDRSSGILPGITRATVIEVIGDIFGSSTRVIERPIKREELYRSREVFFTGSATRVNGVVKIDGREIGHGTDHCSLTGPMTKAISDYYDSLLHGRVLEYKDWLTLVPDRPAAA